MNSPPFICDQNTAVPFWGLNSELSSNETWSSPKAIKIFLFQNLLKMQKQEKKEWYVEDHIPNPQLTPNFLKNYFTHLSPKSNTTGQVPAQPFFFHPQTLQPLAAFYLTHLPLLPPPPHIPFLRDFPSRNSSKCSLLKINSASPASSFFWLASLSLSPNNTTKGWVRNASKVPEERL